LSEVKQPGRKVGHLPLSNAELNKNVWSYTSFINCTFFFNP